VGDRQGAVAAMGLNHRRPDPAFWSGKRVLLTGHTGFKGSWAALWLERLGATVTGLAKAPDQDPSLFELAGVAEAVDSHFVDLRDQAAVEALVASRPFDIVLHMAAQPIVRAAVEDPVEAFATNVMGTAHLLQALRGQPALKAVLAVTTDKVYANADTGRAFVESDPLGGKDPYSGSKAACEIAVASFARTYFDRLGTPVATARGGNVIGGGDYSRDRLVADVVRSVKAGRPLALRHPEATRPWQHVLDCVAGYLVYLEALAQEADTPRAMNFGPEPGGAVITVGELATAALEALGGPPWRHEPDPASVEARLLAIDTTLAGERLGFASRLDGPAAVAWTMDWHKAEAAGQDLRQATLDQIAAYERLP